MLTLADAVRNALVHASPEGEQVIDRSLLVGAVDEVLMAHLKRGVSTTAETFSVSGRVEEEFISQISEVISDTVNFLLRCKYHNMSELCELQQDLDNARAERSEPVKYKADGMIYSFFCANCEEPATEYEGKFGCENCELWPVTTYAIGITDCAPCPA